MTFSFSAAQRALWSHDDKDLWTFEVPEGWGQGRSVYGGLTTSIAAGLVLRHAPEGYTLRGCNVQFLRPVAAGTVSARVHEQRRGKYTSFWEVCLIQDGEEALRANLILGRSRDGATSVDPLHIELAQPVEGLIDLPYIPGVTPEFIQNLRMRWAEGGYPYSGSKEARFAGYCRYKGAADSYEGILGLLDAWPCPSLAKLSTPRPASSITWSAHIVAVPASFDGWFRFRYETVAGGEGFHRVVGHLSDTTGTLIAWTEQLVAVFG